MTDDINEGAKKGGTPGHRGLRGYRSPDYTDPRKEKRGLRRAGLTDPVYDAHNQGGDDAIRGRPYRNRYPKGMRNKAYHRAYHDDGQSDEISGIRREEVQMDENEFDPHEVQTDPAYDAVEMPVPESPIADLLAAVAAERPADAAAAFDSILRDKVADFVATRREEMAQTLFGGPRDEEDEEEQPDLFDDEGDEAPAETEGEAEDGEDA